MSLVFRVIGLFTTLRDANDFVHAKRLAKNKPLVDLCASSYVSIPSPFVLAIWCPVKFARRVFCGTLFPTIKLVNKFNTSPRYHRFWLSVPRNCSDESGLTSTASTHCKPVSVSFLYSVRWRLSFLSPYLTCIHLHLTTTTSFYLDSVYKKRRLEEMWPC